MIFLLATHNQKKRAELERILAPLGVQVRTAEQIGVDLTDVEETGETFRENALLKAESGCRESGLPCVADDSGLEVDALNGAPGVYSARFSGEGHNDAANNAKLIALLKNVPDEERTARFCCCVALARKDRDPIAVQGEVEGTILHEAHGENGFGYDPYFYYAPFKKSFAELTAEEKNSVSHRKRALMLLKETLDVEDRDRI